MTLLPNGEKEMGTSGEAELETTARETALLQELVKTLDDTAALWAAVAQSYSVVLRRTGAGVKQGERLSKRDGEMLAARLELQADGLRNRVRKLAEGWRRGG